MSTIDSSKFDTAVQGNNLNTSDLVTQFDNAKTDIEALETTVGDITAAEADQIENIGTVTISNTQWGYLGALDQDLATTDSVTFGGLTVNGTVDLDGAVTINESGADVDFRVEGDTEVNLLFVDASTDRVGIKTATPGVSLHVSGTDSVRIPVGTTAQRPGTPAEGDIRRNTTLSKFEGYTGSEWSQIGGGAEGGGSDAVFFENDQNVTSDYTITTNKNAMSAGTVTIDNGVTVTVPSGSRWVIV